MAALDERIRSSAPAFHKEMRATWYRCHAGSGDGLVPGTSWGLLSIKDALDEIAFAKSSSGPRELSPNVFVPMVTGRDGRLMYYVVGPDCDAAVWEYERGERVKATRFEDWLERLIASWTQESAVLRVAWVRRERSPMGWTELHLPSSNRAKLRTLLTSLPLRVQDSVRTDGTSAVRFETGKVPSWNENEQGSDDRLVITLSSEGARQLSKSLADKTKESFRIPDVEDLRLVLSQR